ncbi:hypothetical protein [Clostridium sp. BSD9I1]|uniref:hypothetical protein n=1 Tax=Clostridium sp. BSD9I1 TaxID=2003589 RepID=UPI001648DBE0|nr:hypothetical protein [Clostridium sp. BSD9I1]
MERNISKEFDRIKEVENWLCNYKSTKAGIESLKEEYEVLSNNSETENKDIKLVLVDSRIKMMERKIEKIDRALNSLSSIEKEIIEYKCIEGMYYYEFTYRVYKSERQCKRIKKIALEKVAVALGLYNGTFMSL